MLGPLGLGSLIKQFPFLYWLTVVDAKNVAGIAELGVVFLLFLIGMELSFERLKTMRRLVFGLGSLQIILSAAVIGGIAACSATRPRFGHPRRLPCLVLDRDRHRGAFQPAAGWPPPPAEPASPFLLAQDLAVIPMLLLVSIMGSRSATRHDHLGLRW